MSRNFKDVGMYNEDELDALDALLKEADKNEAGKSPADSSQAQEPQGPSINDVLPPDKKNAGKTPGKSHDKSLPKERKKRDRGTSRRPGAEGDNEPMTLVSCHFLMTPDDVLKLRFLSLMDHVSMSAYLREVVDSLFVENKDRLRDFFKIS